MKKAITTILLVFFALLLLFSAWKLFGILRAYKEGQDAYTALEEYISFASPEEQTTTQEPLTEVPLEEVKTPEEASTVEEPDLSQWPQVDFAQLAEINADLVGWIYIEGTNISYPVVQGADNDYYLNRLFDGTYNSSGSIFLDVNCPADFSGRHSIIYGHHMKDDSMFSALMGYKEQAFYDTHTQALLLTPDAYYRIQFFSGYITDTSANTWQLQFGDGEFADWLRKIGQRSCFTPQDLPTEDDRIITLSTCSYEFDSAKFVMHGYISEVIELPEP